jgi:hypothetical protein
VLKGKSVRVLVIEDHRPMAEAVALGLRREGMAVDVALDGPSGLQRALENNYDVDAGGQSDDPAAVLAARLAKLTTARSGGTRPRRRPRYVAGLIPAPADRCPLTCATASPSWPT